MAPTLAMKRSFSKNFLWWLWWIGCWTEPRWLLDLNFLVNVFVFFKFFVVFDCKNSMAEHYRHSFYLGKLNYFKSLLLSTNPGNETIARKTLLWWVLNQDPGGWIDLSFRVNIETITPSTPNRTETLTTTKLPQQDKPGHYTEMNLRILDSCWML